MHKNMRARYTKKSKDSRTERLDKVERSETAVYSKMRKEGKRKGFL